jgi:hypothetical protein
MTYQHAIIALLLAALAALGIVVGEEIVVGHWQPPADNQVAADDQVIAQDRARFEEYWRSPRGEAHTNCLQEVQMWPKPESNPEVVFSACFLRGHISPPVPGR